MNSPTTAMPGQYRCIGIVNERQGYGVARSRPERAQAADCRSLQVDALDNATPDPDIDRMIRVPAAQYFWFSYSTILAEGGTRAI
jgi:hypothetical protein